MIVDVAVPLLVISVLVLVNGAFVAAEFALVGARRSRLESLAEGGSRPARWLVGVFDRHAGKDGYIAVAQLGITLASIGLGMYGEPAVAGWLYGPFERWGLSHAAAHTVGFVVALSAITYLHVVLGEMIPKALALQAPETVSLRVNPLMRAFGLVFRPMVAVLNATAFGLMRLLRIPEPDKRLALHTSAELEIVTDEAASSGQLGEMQRDLIRNVFDLDERTAEELMTPRRRIEAVEVSAASDEVMARVLGSQRSRYPVIDGSLDRVVGVLHVKDAIRACQRDRAVVVADLVRPVPVVTATTPADLLLERFRHDRTHAAMVVDEHGATIGLVTLDDLIVEVMEDEVQHVDAAPVRHGDGSVSVDGGLTLVALAEELGIELVAPDATTVAGAVLAASPTFPAAGTTVVVGDRRITVEEMSDRTIVAVRISTADPDAS